MPKKVVTIYDAKSSLSRLIARAADGETIYIGAFGKAQAILAPLPKQQRIVSLGALKNKSDYSVPDSSVLGPDQEVADLFYGNGTQS